MCDPRAKRQQRISTEQGGPGEVYSEQHQEKGKAVKISRKLNAWGDSTLNGSDTQHEEGTLKENPSYEASKDTEVT